MNLTRSTQWIAVYLRISVDRTGEGVAVARQKTAALEIIKRHGLKGEVKFYPEQGSVSASKKRGEGTQYARLLAEARAGHISVLIVWDLDRLTRIVREMEDWLDLCVNSGLRLITADGEVDMAANADNGRLFLRIKAAVARAEVERKSARQKLAHAQRREAGKPWFARRPFGYEKVGTLRISEAKPLQVVYADFVAGDHNLTHHADRLNAKGCTGTSGAPWNGSSLRQVLLADRNLGGKQWDAMVDEGTFHLVRRVLRDPARTAHGGRAPIAQLTAIALCDVCDGHIGVGHLSSAPRDGGYYICTKSRHVSHPRTLVDRYIDDLVVEHISNPEVLALWATEPVDLTEPYESVDSIDRQLVEIAEDRADGSMTREQFRAASLRLQERRVAAVDAIALATAGSPIASLGRMNPAEWWRDEPLHNRRRVLRQVGEIRLRYRGRGNRSWIGERDVYAPGPAATRSAPG